MGDLEDPLAAAALAAAINDKSSTARFWIVVSIGGLGNPNAADALVAVLRDKEETTRVAAAFALGLLKRSEAVPVLTEALGGKTDWAAFAAVVALGRLGTPEAKDALREGVRKARRGGIREFAARMLETSPTAALTEVLRGRDSNLRFYAARAIPFLRDPAALEALEEARRDPDSSVREAARDGVRRLKRLEAQGAGSSPPEGAK
jgi:HEAT repeat protein